MPTGPQPSDTGPKRSSATGAAQSRHVGRSDRTYFDAINPLDGARFQVAITHRRALWVAQRGEGAIKEMTFLAKGALLEFKQIFEGIRWDVDEDKDAASDGWLCYCARPSKAYRKDGRDCDPPEDMVFLVFVNQDRVAYNWQWVDCDPSNPDLPIDWQSRFKKKALP